MGSLFNFVWWAGPLVMTGVVCFPLPLVDKERSKKAAEAEAWREDLENSGCRSYASGPTEEDIRVGEGVWGSVVIFIGGNASCTDRSEFLLDMEIIESWPRLVRFLSLGRNCCLRGGTEHQHDKSHYGTASEPRLTDISWVTPSLSYAPSIV